MGWRVVYVDEGEHLTLYLDNIKIQDRDKMKEHLISIKDINTLVIDNYRTTLTVHLMNALTKNNVNIVLCNVSHMPQTLIIPQTGNQRVPLMLRKQLTWRKQIKKMIHQSIVQAKLSNQIALLKHVSAEKHVVHKIEQFRQETMLGDKSNLEGLAAKMYFRSLLGNDFKRFDDDPVNAGLNYGYSIIRSVISRGVIAKGLNPALGFFHHGPNNQFNLSDDFIEPFRPFVDYHVYQLLRNCKTFEREHKIELIRATTKKILFNNQKQTLFNAVNLYVDAVVSFAETGDYKKLIHPMIDFDDL